jgi:transposase
MGIPLAVTLTGGNSNDITQLLPLLQALYARPVKGKRGRPRRKPDRLLADRGYDHDRYRRLLRRRGIRPLIARRGVAHGSGLGRERWVVERGFAHLHAFRRLRVRYERRPEIHIAFLTLACAILCWRRLKSL